MPVTRRLLLLSALALTVLMLVLHRREAGESPPPAPAPPEVRHDMYGIERAGYEIVEGRIRRNETFSDLLQPFDVPYPKIVALARKARPVFDVRDLRAGKPYRVYLRDDARRTPAYLVYEQDAVQYVVFSLNDTMQVTARERPVTVTEREAGGVITGSLYNTLVDQGADPALAIEMSEVFAWQIDFYRIQKGDAFSVIYEERSVGGTPIGIGRIRAARFFHSGRDYYAFYYEQDGEANYFDEAGNSLRKAFLIAPVKYARISSRYSGRRFHPVQKRYKAHLGTDYAAPTGTPIRATGDGVVIEARYRQYNGNYVKIRHNGTYATGYLHMSKIAKGIRPGVHVRQGDVIGYVGSTGLANGPHVCYRFWKNGQQVNHLRETYPSAVPVAEAHRAAYTAYAEAMRARLTLDAPDTTPKATDD